MSEVIDRIADFSKTLGETDFLTTIFGDFSLEAARGKIPVTLFGAGAVGKDLCHVLQLHGVQPACFCDNNPTLAGTRQSGILVMSLMELKQSGQDNLIVLSSGRYALEIRQQLIANGFSAEKIRSASFIENFDLLGHYHHCAYYTQNPDHSLSMDALRQNEEQLSAAYHLLADQKSRDIFVARMSLFSSEMDFLRFSQYICDYSELNEKQRDSFPFYVSPEDYGYFNNDIVHLDNDEVLVDGGSYNGLSAATFAKTCENKGLRYKKIYCFEPDVSNSRVAQENTSHLPNVACIHRGLWSHATTMVFLSSGECDPGAFLEVCGDNKTDRSTKRVEIKTVSIDEQFVDEPITFIKLDIEGAEVKAIEGAAKTIQRSHPILAISAYHKHSDIYDLPILIHSLCPDYKLYLRHFGYTLFDMVLFAVPPRSQKP